MSKLLKATIILTCIYCGCCILSIVLMKGFGMQFFRYGFNMSGFLLLNPVILVMTIVGLVVNRLKKAWAYVLCFVASFVMWFIYLMITAAVF